MDTKALRQKILDLAIRGKLVPQDPNDEPASVLLERIRAEKQQMVKDGKLKAKDLKNDSVIFVGDDNLHYEKFSDGTIKCIQDDIPFKLPPRWEWCRLKSICSVLTDGTHQTPTYSDCGYVFLSSKNVTEGRIDWDNVMFIPENLHKELYTRIAPKLNDILLAKNGTTGVAAIVDKDCVFDIYVSLALIRIVSDIISPQYILNAIGSYFVQSFFKKSLKGIGVPNLHLERIRETLLPIPPYNEQIKITKTTNNLISLCEKIGSEKNSLSSLVTLAKNKILDLAIRGKLVSQDPNDEPASILLERIRKEKEELVKSGKLKRDKRESVIFRGEDNSYYETIGNKRACIDSEIHYDIPEGWTVERLKNLYSVNPKNDIANDETIVSFVPMNLINDRFLYNCTYELKQWKDCKKGFTHFADGDLGFAKISPCFENRKSVVFSNLKNGYGAGTTELYILRNFCEGLNPEYAILFLKSESFIERGVDTYSGTVGQQRIDKNIMMDTIIPIPPQNEQQRIADRVKQLFSILDSIQATIV